MKLYSFLLLLLTSFYVSSTNANSSKPMVISNYAGWASTASGFHVKDIPAEMLTHVIYNYAGIEENGAVKHWDIYYDITKNYPGDRLDGQEYRGNFHQLNLLKKKHPHLKTLLTIGGWGMSDNYPAITASSEKRERFVQTAIAFVQRYRFDGMVIDWRYPAVTDLIQGKEIVASEHVEANNLSKLLSELRNEITKRELDLILSTTTFNFPKGVARLPMEQISKDVDFFYLITHDFTGEWSPYPAHAAPLYYSDLIYTKEKTSVHDMVALFLNRGVPPEKLVITIPSIGRSWAGTGGLFQKAAKIPQGTMDAKQGSYTGTYTREHIKQFLNNPEYKQVWDSEAKASYLYSKTRLNGHFISFDDYRSIFEKLNYAKRHKLGGVATPYNYNGKDVVSQAYHFFYPSQSIVTETVNWLKANWLLLLLNLLLIFTIIGWLFHFRDKKKSIIQQKELYALEEHLKTLQSVSEQLTVDPEKYSLSKQQQNNLGKVVEFAKKLSAEGIDSNQIQSILDALQQDEFIAAISNVIPDDRTEENQDMLKLVEQLKGELLSLCQNPGLLSELYRIISNRQRLLYIKAEKGYSGLYLQQEKKPIYLYSRLKQLKFYYGRDFLLQIHRSYLVNRNKLNRIYEKDPNRFIALVDTVEIPVGGSYLSELRKNHPDLFEIFP